MTPIFNCGCCGGPMATATQLWCERCKEHVLPVLEFWEGTYFAQHGKPCPYSVNNKSSER